MGRQTDRNETAESAETARESRALALSGPSCRDEGPARCVGGRPMAAFVTQLLLGADSSLQVTRLERTRAAAAHYARTAASLAETRSA